MSYEDHKPFAIAALARGMRELASKSARHSEDPKMLFVNLLAASEEWRDDLDAAFIAECRRQAGL